MSEQCRACKKPKKTDYRIRLYGPGRDDVWTAPWCGEMQCEIAIRKEVLDLCKLGKPS